MTQLNIKINISKCSSHITSVLNVYSFHYNDLTISWYNYSKCYVTVALLLKHKFVLWKMMNNIKCLDYESEATEDWVWSDMISFKMPVVGREKKIIYLYHCYQYLFFLQYSKCLLEGDRAGSWWKPFIFLDEASFNLAKRWRWVWERPRTMFAGGLTTPHWMWFWGSP